MQFFPAAATADGSASSGGWMRRRGMHAPRGGRWWVGLVLWQGNRIWTS